MIFEGEIQEGSFHISDETGQLICIPYGSSWEKLWRNRDAIFSEIKLLDEPDNEQLAIFIHLAKVVGWFEVERYRNREGHTKAKRREDQIKLSGALFTVIAALKNIDTGLRMDVECFMDDEIEDEFAPPYSLDKLLKELNDLRKYVDIFMIDEKAVKVGNTKDVDLHDLVFNLASIYEQCVGKKPAKPFVRANKNDAYDRHSLDGPFYRFCVEVMTHIDSNEIRKLPHAITAVLKTR